MSVRRFGAGHEVGVKEMARSGLLVIAEGAHVSVNAVFVPADLRGEARRVEIGPGCRVAACAVIHGGTVLGEETVIEEHVVLGKPEHGYAVGHVYPGTHCHRRGRDDPVWGGGLRGN